MSSSKTNIPRTIKEFNTFITTVCAYLVLGSPTNATRLGITATMLAQLQAYLSQWNPLYASYLNRKGTYTTALRNSLLGIIDAMVLYDKINKVIEKVKATANLTTEDCSVFNLPQGLSMALPTAHSVPVAEKSERTLVTVEAVYPKLISEVGGYVKVKVYTAAVHTGRAKKLKGFDLLDYAVAVFYSGTGNLPTHATDSRLTQGHSSKASFVVETPGMTSNLPVLTATQVEPLKIAVFFFRWAKSKHTDQDGPWSGPFTVVLQ
ncbi:MAG: hypothetical protein ABR968_04085 [Bacteroidales bacterium]